MAIERIVPGTKEWEAFYANHIMRYQFAAGILQTMNNARILDAACGVGYGSHYLSALSTVSDITAVDRSVEALTVARSKFAAATIRFIEDDCHTLQETAAYAPFDAVVSFETLEHLPKPADFLRCCFNNLKSGGKIIISTPNQLVSSPEQLNWEYHEKEYTPAELMDALQAVGFSNVRLYGQQFNIKGKIKNEVRGDLNRLFSNPFIRAGRWLQQKLKGHQDFPILKETMDDFEIISFARPEDCAAMGLNGPFVLIAVAEK